MTEKKTDRRIITPPFRAAFPKLFTPEKRSENDPKLYYGLEAIFAPDEDLSKLKALAKQVAMEHWNRKPPRKLESPFKSGDEHNADREDQGKEPREELKGCTFMRFHTTAKPEVVDKKKQFITDESEVYSGCCMRASVYCHPYDNKTDPQKGNGITFMLNNVQKLKDDEQWGSPRKTAAEDFDDELSESTEAETDFADDNDGDDIRW